MASESEYANYSSDELNKKANRYKKVQIGMMVMAVAFAAIVGIYSAINELKEGYQMAGIFLVAGIAYPLLTFGAMRKKIKAELENRQN
ncbi:hypothetical protein BXY85_4065 [Roseivirga pacifica]|uniref:Uncharacterized protein n=1 Tax=Roseivirga pacifica TaxID=1267423 RepID=A0A1I0PXI2_9BACT|nr:hypothetical protein [Roseivirga pacifica]RKQ43443.1 hypothetical protein BXY85_4065 [Roseivirga pacifica]SEW19253.1 hypothetical protein SAMN05216290_1810 [Roseivirga pacifica]